MPRSAAHARLPSRSRMADTDPSRRTPIWPATSPSPRCTSTIVDVPTVRKHKLSHTSVTAQNYVIVQVRLANGVEGIGEAATLGGPRWSEESVEAMKANIDAYLAPAIIGHARRPVRGGRPAHGPGRQAQQRRQGRDRDGAVRCRRQDARPAVSALLGGAVRDRIPVLWTLASGDPAQEIEEAERKLAARLHRTFKVKIGAQAPEADMARHAPPRQALEGRAELIVDANQAWDETDLRPLPAAARRDRRRAWSSSRCRPGTSRAMARLRARPGTPPLLADECVFDAHDMLAVAQPPPPTRSR